MIITEKVYRDSAQISLNKILKYLKRNGWKVSHKKHLENDLYFISKYGKSFILPPEEYIDFESRTLEALCEIARVELRRPSEVFDDIAKIEVLPN